MFQTTKIFDYYSTCDEQLDNQINNYLKEHPDLYINSITVLDENNIIVVFSQAKIHLNQNDGDCSNNAIRHSQLGDIMLLGGNG